MWRYIHTDEMYHHGILGQKWGIRRYQNKDGSLTPAGRKRANKLENEYNKLTGKKLKRDTDKDENNKSDSSKKQNIKKAVSQMSDADLKNRLTRLENEKRLVQLEKERVSTGQKLLTKIGNDVVKPSLIDAGKNTLTAYLTKVGKEALGVEGNTKNPDDELKKKANRLKLEKQVIENQEWLDKHRQSQNLTLEDDILDLMDNGRRALTEDVKFKKKKK